MDSIELKFHVPRSKSSNISDVYVSKKQTIRISLDAFERMGATEESLLLVATAPGVLYLGVKKGDGKFGYNVRKQGNSKAYMINASSIKNDNVTEGHYTLTNNFDHKGNPMWKCEPMKL